jgi:hypothetical protein
MEKAPVNIEAPAVTSVPTVLPRADLAGHPRNPHSDLGDLAAAAP